MATKPGAKLHLPEGMSPDEEAEWWDTHADELDWDTGEIEVLPPMPVVRTGDTHLRLPLWMIEALKKRAESTGFSYQWLVRTWIEERLRQEGITRPAPQPNGAGDRASASSLAD